MSEEEKKAIQELTEIKELVEEDLKYDDYEVTATLDQIDLKSLVIVLNLIEKQQKEIGKEKERNEELKDDNKKKSIVIIEYQDLYEKLVDKIKAKIEECEKEKNIPHEMDFKAFYRIKDLKNIEIKVLQSLLEKE